MLDVAFLAPHSQLCPLRPSCFLPRLAPFTMRLEQEPAFPPAGVTRCHFTVQSCEAAYLYTGEVELGYQGNPAHVRRLLEGDWIKRDAAEGFNPITAVSLCTLVHKQVCVC